MSDEHPIDRFGVAQQEVGALRCSLETTRPAGWQAKEGQLCFVRQRYEAGNPLALYDGLTLCRDGELPLPTWLADGLASFMRQAMAEGIKGQRGKGNSFLGEARKARLTEIRGHMVWAIRQVQNDRRHWLGLPHPLKLQFLAGQTLNFGHTEEAAFGIASLALRSTIARGSESTMRKAYREVNAKPELYLPFRAHAETEHAFGLRIEGEPDSLRIPDWVSDWVAGRPVKP